MPEIEINPQVAPPSIITAVDNLNPLGITTQDDHLLRTGERVLSCQATGNTCANGSNLVTVTGAKTFTLDGVDGTLCGTWISGGIVNRQHEFQIIPYASRGGLTGGDGPGPWLYNGYWYMIFRDVAGISSSPAVGEVAGEFNDSVEMWRWPASGAGSAEEMDELNHPNDGAATARIEEIRSNLVLGAYRSGNIVWVGLSINTASPSNFKEIVLRSFNLSTGLWGSYINSGTLPQYPNSPFNGSTLAWFDLIVNGDGSISILYPQLETVASVDRVRPALIRYSSGSWGTPVILLGSGEAKGYWPLSMTTTSSGRLHVICATTRSQAEGGQFSGDTALYHIALQYDAASIASSSVIATEVDGENGTWGVCPILLYNDGSDQLVIAYQRGALESPASGFFSPVYCPSVHVLSAAEALTPSWSNTTILTLSTPPFTPQLPFPPEPSNQAFNDGGLGRFCYNSGSNTLQFWWYTAANEVTGDNPAEIYYMEKVGAAAWGSPTLAKTGNGADAYWSAKSAAPINQPGAIWYGFPIPTIYGSQTVFLYSKWDQWRVIDCVTSGDPGSRLIEYPHYDLLDMCPPVGSGRKRYAYFRQLPC